MPVDFELALHWERCAAAAAGPRSRSGHTLVAVRPVERQLALFGGFAASAPDEAFNDLWLFDTQRLEWREMIGDCDRRPCARKHHASASDASGSVFIHAGQTPSPTGAIFLDDLWMVIIRDGASGVVWRDVMQRCAIPRAFHQLQPHGDGALLCFGGFTGCEWADVCSTMCIAQTADGTLVAEWRHEVPRSKRWGRVAGDGACVACRAPMPAAEAPRACPRCLRCRSCLQSAPFCLHTSPVVRSFAVGRRLVSISHPDGAAASLPPRDAHTMTALAPIGAGSARLVVFGGCVLGAYFNTVVMLERLAPEGPWRWSIACGGSESNHWQDASPQRLFSRIAVSESPERNISDNRAERFAPANRAYHVAWALAHRFVVIHGGFCATHRGDVCLSDTAVYDSALNRWAPAANYYSSSCDHPTPPPRVGAAAAAVGTRDERCAVCGVAGGPTVWVFGGDNGKGDNIEAMWKVTHHRGSCDGNAVLLPCTMTSPPARVTIGTSLRELVGRFVASHVSCFEPGLLGHAH